MNEPVVRLDIPQAWIHGDVAAAFDDLIRTIDRLYHLDAEERCSIALVIPPPLPSLVL
jgi:hypothetical protein